MYKRFYMLVSLMTLLAGCYTDSHVYRNQPLVAEVDTGMTKEQVVQIGGPPLSITERTAVPGTCFDYTFIQSGQKQPFNVSFNGQGKVDHTSFISCAQWSHIQQKARKPSHSSGSHGY
ncbi:osmotically-inducible lipoprotein OsmE [Pseudomonas sp. PD9R]|uniref:osmotically-inducible lipoprotein OsmE n=1 Tax=Pseudomonas sp. PD9R TaxID=2853534 RepID=UPI001C480ABC|nr:osmotically-inducible lipoprotein OsmE [Pseudomonas sp. PD9R]MBV6824566.1 osmotically-inducible lipoprotein OsmE [Pseudomonas sp. PD9R]